MAVVEDVEQVAPLLGVERGQTPVVEDEEVTACRIRLFEAPWFVRRFD